MSEKVFLVARSLNERLLHFTSQLSSLPSEYQTGLIIGWTSIEDTNLTTCIGCVTQESYSPVGYQSVGVYSLDSQMTDDDLAQLCQDKVKGKKGGKLIVLIPDGQEVTQLICKLYDIKSKKLSEFSYELCDDEECNKQAVMISCKVKSALSFEFDKENLDKNVEKSVSKLKGEVKAMAFKLAQSSYELKPNEKSNTSMVVSELYNQLEADEMFDGIEIPANMKKKMLDKMRKEKINARTGMSFEAVSSSLSGDENDGQIDMIEIPNGKKNITFPIELKSILFVQLHSNLSSLIKCFQTSLTRQLDDIHKCVLNYADYDNMILPVPKVFNFYPQQVCQHFITIVYPGGMNDALLIAARKEIHLRYLLPMDRPLTRKGNQFQLGENKFGKLINVHLGLKSLLKNGKSYIVSGNYSYHHYMQDKTDDNGWGCAYRSLQSIVSWFRHQGYIMNDIPTHKDIQQALVDVGDKQASFVGSRLWIGSQEVSFVLNHLYGITSKIMFVNSGGELANKGRELAHHFETQETPIMIGGGVLAHTILGIDFDENTGDIKFLILDPHYTGAEDITVIHKKGWCGWKDSSFWDKNSFYNLCMPQRPLEY